MIKNVVDPQLGFSIVKGDDEAGRLAALAELEIARGGEPLFDQLVELAANILEAPISLISLVGEDTQWFKARIGLEAEGTPREVSFCQHTILGQEVFVVEDTNADLRFTLNPLVTGAPNIRFYAGAPLTTKGGHRIGTFCVIDTKPRALSEFQIKVLRTLSHQAVALFEARMFERRAIERDAAAQAAVQQAQAASMAKSAFLTTMSHELRTPMNVIVGATSLLKRTAPLSEQQSRLLDTLKSSSDSLLHLLNDFLDLSKIESGKLVLECTPFRLAEAFEQTEALMRGAAEEKGLAWQTRLDFPPDLVVIGDAHRLRQVIVNLVSNSVKFTSEGGITLSVAMDPAGREIVINVQDTGVGIPEDRVREIFEPFQQAQESTAREYGGTGLGLAICLELVSAMGGELLVSSTEGLGSKFTIILPLEMKPSVL